MAAMNWTRGDATRMDLLSLFRGSTQQHALQAEIMNSSMGVQCLNDDGPSSTRTTALARTSWRFYGGASAATGHSTSTSYTPLSSRKPPPQQQEERHLSNPHLHRLHLLLLHKIIANPPSSPSSRPSPTPARASTARAPIHPSLPKNGSPAQQPISSATQFHPLLLLPPRYRQPKHSLYPHLHPDPPAVPTVAQPAQCRPFTSAQTPCPPPPPANPSPSTPPSTPSPSPATPSNGATRPCW